MRDEITRARAEAEAWIECVEAQEPDLHALCVRLKAEVTARMTINVGLVHENAELRRRTGATSPTQQPEEGR